MMHQDVPFWPLKVEVEGQTSSDGRFEYIGTAYVQPDGKYRCLAKYDMKYLVRVEVTIDWRNKP
jgi:hypothetical protein